MNSKKSRKKSKKNRVKNNLHGNRHALPSLKEVRNGLDKKNKEEKEVSKNECSLYHEDDGLVCKDDQVMIRTLEKQHDNIIDNYNTYNYL